MVNAPVGHRGVSGSHLEGLDGFATNHERRVHRVERQVRQSHAVGHVDDFGQAHLVGQAQKSAVYGKRRGLDDAHYAVGVAGVVVHQPVQVVAVGFRHPGEQDGARRSGQYRVVDVVAHLEGGDEREELEPGAWLALPLGGVVELVGPGVGPSHQRLDVARAGVQDSEGGHHVGEAGGDVPDRDILGVGLQRRHVVGIDLQAAGEQGAHALFRGGAKGGVGEQFVDDLVHVIAVDGVRNPGRIVDHGGQGGLVGDDGLCGRDRLVKDHA